MSNLYVGLVHHPINNKNGEVVTTSVTNLDIHDISRSCRTFGVSKFFLVTPLKAQHELVGRILGHWESDKANAYNPDRQSALSSTGLINSVEDACAEITELEGQAPSLIVTGANFSSYDGAAEDLASLLKIDKRPYFLLFGTGWGLHASLVERADYRLEPLFGAAPDGYNHLSVRSAAAIYLDRLKARERPLDPSSL